MQLKKLEMSGFKSFANPTQIVFERGITGIVGPNGCGKSNVVDAIRWVLGTMSHKAVRGEEMLDVIFKGAQGVAPVGYAEVSLVLDNSDRTMPIEYDEVVITRRLHRSKESEYLINRSPVRLKDIRNLLYGTGIGTDNYSIIEQGQIDRLVLSSPQERRLVFDEAAGVSRYRARRHETELRLEKVKQDLVRMQDVLREVQRELRGVRAQAGRAQRFRELEEQFRTRRVSLSLLEWREFVARRDALLQERAESEQRRDRDGANKTAQETVLQKVESELAALEARVSDLRANRAGLVSKDEFLRPSLQRITESLAEMERTAQRLDRELSSHEARTREATEGSRRATEEAETARRSVLSIDAEALEAAERLRQGEEECRKAADELERCRAEAVELAHKESQYRTESARVDEDLAGVKTRVERSGERLQRAREEHRSVAARLEEVVAQEAAATEALQRLQERRQGEVRKLELLRDERSRHEAQLEELRLEREAKLARRESLRDLEGQQEGLDEGARALLKSGSDQVLGTVADLVEVDPEMLPAVEQALGERAGYVVMRTSESAWSAVRDASTSSRPVGVIAIESSVVTERSILMGEEGVRGRASEFVRAKTPEASVLIDRLLGSVLIVNNAAAAERIARGEPSADAMVTVDGLLWEPGGVVRTGRSGGVRGLLARKAELRRLEAEVEAFTQRMLSAQEQRAELEERTQAGERELESIRQGVYEHTVARTEAGTTREQIEKRRTFLDDEIAVLSAECTEFGERQGSLTGRREELSHLQEGAGKLREQVEVEVGTRAQQLEAYRITRSQLQEQVTALRVRRGQEEERASALEQRATGLAEEAAYLTDALTRVREQRENLTRQSAAETERLQSARQELDEITRQLQGVNEALAAAETERARCEEGTREARACVEETTRRIAEHEEKLQNLRVEEGELRVREQHLQDRAREELQVDLSAQQGEEAAAPVDRQALAAEVDELRHKLQSFGAVNVVALDQLKELETREQEFLTQQKDLTGTQEQLNTLIKELNQQSRVLFDKTLETVRSHFTELFRKLFAGGKADIVLTESETGDPMDCGLEIMARPPHKEVSTLRLLSGGERSLTALALVMALFRANPSPFCILDEADAALDESNVGKYGGVLREYISDTQFIVVTHNHRTMAVADVLYGITMETPGVSKRVKVDLRGDGKIEVVRKSAEDRKTVEPTPEFEASSSTSTAVMEEEPGSNPETPDSRPQTPDEHAEEPG